MPVKESFYQAKGKPKQERLKKIVKVQDWRTGNMVDRERWVSGKYTQTIWHFADEIEPTGLEKNRAKRRWDENDLSLKKRPLTEWEVARKELEDGLGDQPLRNVVGVSLGAWKSRNKLLILAPLSLLNRTNYGVVNHPDIIADIYPHNPTQVWDTDEKGDD